MIEIFSIIKAIALSLKRPFCVFLTINCLFLILNLPLGYLILHKIWPAIKEKLLLWEKLLLSIIFGFSIFAIVFYISVLLKLNIGIIIFVLYLFLVVWLVIPANKMALFSGNSKNNQHTFDSKLALITLVLIFIYYAIQPLTLVYGFARDYDIAALGIKQTSNFVLPFYNIENYYPPLVSSVSVCFSKLIDNLVFVNLNQLMIVIFSTVVFLLFCLAYFIGFLFFGNRKAGVCCLAMMMLLPATRNAVIGGSTYPAVLANFYFLVLILALVIYFIDRNKKITLLTGVAFSGILLSHLDIFISFGWFILAALITVFIYEKDKLKTVLFALKTIMVGLIISMPYLYYGFVNKFKFSALWTDEKWMAKMIGESHPKPLGEIFFFSGFIPWLIAFASAISFVYLIKLKKEKNKNMFYFFFILWLILIFIQNSWAMAYLTRPFIHIYPLNIMMWTGLTVFLLLIGGFSLSRLNNIFGKRKATANILTCFFIAFGFINIADYETLNLQKVFRPGAGFFWTGISDKNTVVSDGDNKILNWARKNSSLNNFLVPDNYAGYYLPVATEKKALLIFYEGESYHDPKFLPFMDSIYSRTTDFFNQPDSDKSKEFLRGFNLKYIYLPACLDTNSYSDKSQANQHYSIDLLNGDFKIIKRIAGAKIIEYAPQDNKKTKLIHLEAENFVLPEKTKKYYYPKSISLGTAVLKNDSEIIIPLNFTNYRTDLKKEITVYIKYLAFPWNIPFKISIGDFSTILEGNRGKIGFTESMIKVPADKLLIQNQKIINLKISLLPVNSIKRKLLNFIPLEIDWVEIEI